MATKLLYLYKFNVITAEATVVAVNIGANDVTDIVLDKTCFYPRGGGQDWDEGRISSESGTFIVNEVRLDGEGIVHHLGHFQNGTFAVGTTVSCKVDSERRDVNTRLHSAGHIVDMAVDQLGLPWVPGRGGHYPHMSFVEYSVSSETVVDDKLKGDLQEKINELLQSTYNNKIMFLPPSEMGQYCRHIPPNMPTNKPSRIVLYADNFGIPCGGTHVKRATDIGEVVLTKMKVKKGLLKVSYSVKGIQ